MGRLDLDATGVLRGRTDPGLNPAASDGKRDVVSDTRCSLYMLATVVRNKIRKQRTVHGKKPSGNVVTAVFLC